MYKVGQANDIHKLKKNIIHDKAMVIGGTSIQSKYRIKAHSDGDIILHSIAESIYGALGIGDLGTYFSDKSKKNKNMCSRDILAHAMSKMDEMGFEIVNLDFTVICQKVHFASYKEKILTILMKLLNTKSINFKATKWEDGKNKKIQVNSIILLKPKNEKVKPLDKDRLIEFINVTSESFTKKSITNDKEVKEEIKDKTVTKNITEYINKIDNKEITSIQKNEKYYDENGKFKKLKKVRD